MAVATFYLLASIKSASALDFGSNCAFSTIKKKQYTLRTIFYYYYFCADGWRVWMKEFCVHCVGMRSSLHLL